MDIILFTMIGVNDVSTPEAENVARVESVTSTLACVEYMPERSRRSSYFQRFRNCQYGEMAFVVPRESQKAR